MEESEIQVICYSGYQLNERPVRVIVRGDILEVCEIMDRWYGVGYTYFKVRLDNGSKMILKYDKWDDGWEGRIVADRNPL